MRGTFVALLMAFALAAAPTASAVTVSKELGYRDYYVVAAEPGAPAGIYEETNGCEGFQGTPEDCDGDGDQEPSDDRVDSVQDLWGLLGQIQPHVREYGECVVLAVLDSIEESLAGSNEMSPAGQSLVSFECGLP